MSTYLPCRVCGLETDVSPGYIGTFVKCVLCRHTHTSRKELAAVQGPSSEEKMKEFLAEVEEDVVIRAAEKRVKKRKQKKPDEEARLSTPPPEEIY